MSYHKLKTIAVSQENYLRLKKLGDEGDSFIEVVKKLIAEHGGKEDYVVSLGSDLGFDGRYRRISKTNYNVGPGTGKYKENE
jgi:hypothetical protein